LGVPFRSGVVGEYLNYQAFWVGKREERTGKNMLEILDLKPLNLFMKRDKNIFFETHSARKNTSASNPLILIMGISLFPLNNY